MNKAKRRNDEDALQRACVQLAALYEQQGRCRYFAVPNGGKRDAVTGAILKRQGVRAGVPDIVLLRYKAVCFVELKTATGRLSPAQEDWRDWMLERGIGWAMARSLNEFKSILDRFVMGAA